MAIKIEILPVWKDARVLFRVELGMVEDRVPRVLFMVGSMRDRRRERRRAFSLEFVKMRTPCGLVKI